MGSFICTTHCLCPLNEKCPIRYQVLLNRKCALTGVCELVKPFGKCQCSFRKEGIDFYSGVPVRIKAANVYSTE